MQASLVGSRQGRMGFAIAPSSHRPDGSSGLLQQVCQITAPSDHTIRQAVRQSFLQAPLEADMCVCDSQAKPLRKSSGSLTIRSHLQSSSSTPQSQHENSSSELMNPSSPAATRRSALLGSLASVVASCSSMGSPLPALARGQSFKRAGGIEYFDAVVGKGGETFDGSEIDDP